MSDPTYTIAVSWNNDILVLTLSGISDKQNIEAMIGKIVGLCLQNRPARLLLDSRELNGRPGILDTYQLMKGIPIEDNFIVPKIAVIDTPENRNIFSFHETKIRNIGLDIRFFTAEDEALLWLSDGASE